MGRGIRRKDWRGLSLTEIATLYPKAQCSAQHQDQWLEFVSAAYRLGSAQGKLESFSKSLEINKAKGGGVATIRVLEESVARAKDSIQREEPTVLSYMISMGYY